MGGVKVVVYGLSTEGYSLACDMAIKGADVSIIDESSPSAISLKAEIAKTYPNVNSLKEDEPLLAMEPIDTAISKSKYLFLILKEKDFIQLQKGCKLVSILSVFL